MEYDTDNSIDSLASKAKANDQDEPLPGFRFHPTDTELVGFYLRRKVEKKPIKFDLIKHVDIYKLDPWDLPSSVSGDKEGYFFCKRGRKYRNSIRPNRVTGSGYWKATGIDKPIYSNEEKCIGLKKTLVYYCGSAGKGTKTNWMMHEFRLPPSDNSTVSGNPMNVKFDASPSSDTNMPEAEVWTLCRIFQRSISHKKCTSEWNDHGDKRQSNDSSSKNTSVSRNKETLLCFSAPAVMQQSDYGEWDLYRSMGIIQNQNEQQYDFMPSNSFSSTNAPSTHPVYHYGDDVCSFVDFDELRPMVDFAFNQSNFM